MRRLIASLALMMSLAGGAHAAELDGDIQAIILSPGYAAAAASANLAVNALGGSYVATIGQSSRTEGDGHSYFVSLPIHAVRVPLSPEPATKLGEIVAQLQHGLNAPLPEVLALYFKPAEALP